MLLEPAPATPGRGERALRVLHVVQHLKSGGAETVVRGLTAALRRDHPELNVGILSLYADALTESERRELGVPIVSLERRGRSDVVGFYARLVGAIRAARPDVVHAHLHAGKYAGRIGAILARVPAIVFTEHGDEAGGVVRRLANAALHPQTKRFIVFSEEQRRAFARREGIGLERIVAIPNGVAEPPLAGRASIRRELGLPDDAFVLFMPARLTSQKNHALALRAFASAFAADPTARLIIAGSGPLDSVLRALAIELGLGDRATFLGFRSDAPRLMRGMDLLVMSSVWEKMPIALGEAMLAGLPVVTTPWTGYRDFVDDGRTGIVASGPDVDAFASALLRARPEEMRSRIATNARAFATEAFSLESSVAKHAELYAEVAREAGIAR